MILEYKKEDGLYSERILAGLAKSLLIFLFRMKNRVETITGINQGYINLYRQFIYELEQNFKSDHYVTDYTDRLNATEKRLNRACKAITGQTASLLIQKRIDHEVKRLLFYSTKSVKEIGFGTGFRDSSYFNVSST
ncbi:MAG: helix-turn-helix domain-containing protein [Cyclobacteriaceae bacterium]|nr:helix-turn-helix domain-containing protein [Cyclobacteriaceae bacterium]